MIEKCKIQLIKENKSNPRYINSTKFKKLVKSIKEFPEMLEKRPIVVDETMTVLGGNMRLKACKSAGLFEVYIHKVLDWSEEQKKEFIIKDNVGFGEWDWDILANDWSEVNLNDWGLQVWQTETDVDIDDLYIDVSKDNEKTNNKIILKYDNELVYNEIIDKIKDDGRKAEDILKEALKL
jgi:hypothetical protein